MLAPQASATVATLAASNESVTLTGVGANSSGQGVSTVKWGNCSFDGTNTKCQVSGTFTGIGLGGTYKAIFTYPGNGPSPLQAVSNTPGSDFVFFNLIGQGSFDFTLTENSSGTVHTFSILTYQFFYNSAAKCTVVASCAVGQVGLTAGATITGPVIGSYDATPVIRNTLGMITVGDYGAFPAVAPGSWTEIYGLNLSDTPSYQLWAGSDFTGNTAPTRLGTNSVTIGGKAGFVELVSNGQMNAQVPAGVAAGNQPVVVTTWGGISAPYSVPVNALQPGLYAPPIFKLNAGQYVGALYVGTTNFVLPTGAVSQFPLARPAKPGEIITLFGTGFGPQTPDNAPGQIVQLTNALQSSLQISIGGVPVEILYKGLAQTFVGLYQFNIVVPNVAAGPAVPLTFSLGGSAGTQTLLIAIGN
jgi:uncharacterized protein (TIGR03437 family)